MSDKTLAAATTEQAAEHCTADACGCGTENVTGNPSGIEGIVLPDNFGDDLVSIEQMLAKMGLLGLQETNPVTDRMNMLVSELANGTDDLSTRYNVAIDVRDASDTAVHNSLRGMLAAMEAHGKDVDTNALKALIVEDLEAAATNMTARSAGFVDRVNAIMIAAGITPGCAPDNPIQVQAA